jgi:hypothetical protein
LCFWTRCWAPPGIGCVACFTGEAAPQAPGSYARVTATCVASQWDSASPGNHTRTTQRLQFLQAPISTLTWSVARAAHHVVLHPHHRHRACLVAPHVLAVQCPLGSSRRDVTAEPHSVTPLQERRHVSSPLLNEVSMFSSLADPLTGTSYNFAGTHHPSDMDVRAPSCSL